MINSIRILVLTLIVSFSVEVQSSDDNALYYQNLGIDIDLNGVVEPQIYQTGDNIEDLSDDEMLAYQDYFENLLDSFDYSISADFPQPTASDLLEYATIYYEQGIDGLLGIDVFSELATLNQNNPSACDTYMHKYFYDLARIIEPQNTEILSQQIESILNGQFLQNQIDASLGENWQIDNPNFYQETSVIEEGNNANYLTDFLGYLQDAQYNIDDEDINAFMPVETPIPIDDLPSDALIIKKEKANKKNNAPVVEANRHVFSETDCQNLENQGIDSTATYSYTKHPEFTIYYTLCGKDAVYADYFENTKNKYYLMPNWSLEKIDDCSTYNKTCAPMYIQMIADNIIYQRDQFRRAHYKLPGHWNINIKGFKPGLNGSAILGTINLYAPNLLRRSLREIIWHEYFHAIQTQYNSEWQYLFNGEWTGSSANLRFRPAWWSQLESIADWSIDAIRLGDNPYPSYLPIVRDTELSVYDARNHLFNAVYHPLEYGYLAERYSGKGNKISSCLGCDTILQYLKVLDSTNTWQNSLAAVTILLNGFANNSNPFYAPTFAQFVRDYHLDLLFSRMDKKWATNSQDFRFLNRSAIAGKPEDTFFPPLLDWPPATGKIPDKLEKLVYGTCQGDVKPVKRVNAKQVGNKFIQGFSCEIRMAPTGAIYLDLPLDQANLPDKIMLKGFGVQLVDDDVNARLPPKSFDNFRIKPGQFIDANLRIFSVPAELTPKDTLEYNKTHAKTLLGNMANDSGYVLSLKANQPSANHLFLAIEYPIFSAEWQKTFTHAPSAKNFMARIVVVAYWDN